jgi:hypothetical protein
MISDSWDSPGLFLRRLLTALIPLLPNAGTAPAHLVDAVPVLRSRAT